ncbi:MAG: family ATPase [Actinomycetia bacterium]|nr:family ATPase [Actinomycetes bacterium]
MGKTSLVEAAFPYLITAAGDGDTTVTEFVGEYTQRPDGSYEFIYGPLVRAMLEGRVLFTDDATLISPSVLAVCYPAMFSLEFAITEGCLPGTRAVREGRFTCGFARRARGCLELGQDSAVSGSAACWLAVSRFARGKVVH